jgi:hypothetical protein
MTIIASAVGRNGRNLPQDVNIIQELLLNNAERFRVSIDFTVTRGRCDEKTITLIEIFQKNVVGMTQPTGLVEPNSRTWVELNRQSIVVQDTVFDEALLLLESSFINFGERFIQDARVRENYVAEARKFSEEIVAEVKANVLTPKQGAERANQMRNTLLDAGRLKSSDVGTALAEAEKATGLALSELMEKYAQRFFNRPFAQLTAAEQDGVFIEIAKASGRPNPKFTSAARNFGKVGRGLVVVSIAIAAYSIATSDRPGRESVRQGTSAGIGFLGSIAGGAAAGFVCGPGAPVCVGVGALIGGVAFAFGAELTFDWLWQ